MASPGKIGKIYELLSLTFTKDQKEALVFAFTDKRTTSTRIMSDHEAENLIKHLTAMIQPMRNKIASRLAETQGWTTDKNKPDYKKINEFLIERTGDKNPRKKGLYKLNKIELNDLCGLVDKMYSNNQKYYRTNGQN